MKIPKERRHWRNFLIDPGFQLRLAGALFLLIVALAAVLYLALLSPALIGIQTVDEHWARYISAQLNLLLVDRVVLVLALFFIIASIYFVIFSHRLCGPLVNIGHTLDCLGRSDLTRPVNLRRRDFLKKQAAKLNAALTNLNSQMNALKGNQVLLQTLTGQLPAGTVSEQIHRLVMENQKLLDQWSVTPFLNDNDIVTKNQPVRSLKP